MRRLHPRLIPAMILAMGLAAGARAMSPLATFGRTAPIAPARGVLGVNAHAPTKYEPENPASRANWAAFDALLKELPKGTPVRADLYFYEWAWDARVEYGFEHVDAKVRALARSGNPVLWTVVPLPWPGAPGWAARTQWGMVVPEETDELVKRFKRFVVLLRASMRAHGMPERGMRFQIGNEPGAGHPGGNPALPKGQWDERTGALYERMVAGTDFGAMQLILPSLSFQDEVPEVAKRERESARPILRRLGRAKVHGGSVAASHVRYYAPGEPMATYAANYLRRVAAFLQIARGLSGRKFAIAPEIYLFREDRGATDDRTEILRLIAPKLPRGCFLYRVGPGPNDPTTQLPVSAVRASSSR